MQRRPSLTEGKLMIMRVLKSMEPLDENQLAEFFAEPDLLTFFEIKVALDELQGSETLTYTHITLKTIRLTCINRI